VTVKIKVRSIGLIRQVMGGPEVVVEVPEGTNLPGLLDHLVEERGEKFAPFAVRPEVPTAYAPVRIVLNGRDVAPMGRENVVLKEGDDVLMFLPIAGG
jgi:molybdopterin converting factor small subunit